VPEPKAFSKDPSRYREFIGRNPGAIVVSESDNYSEHPDIMHAAICFHVSGKRQTVGDWTKLVFCGLTQNDVKQWYRDGARTEPRACSQCGGGNL
jgi:hypothetical protein